MEQNTNRMWMTIGVLVLGSILLLAQTSFGNELTEKLGAKITQLGKKVDEANYGENGRFDMDENGNAIVKAIDPDKPIIITTVPAQTINNKAMKTLVYKNQVVMKTDMSKFLFGNSQLETITGLNLFDTAQVTNMSRFFAFNPKLKALPGIENWNTSSVTQMTEMFNELNTLTQLNVSKWNTSNVTQMNGTFRNMYAVTTIGDLSSWNTSKVKTFNAMFQADHNINNVGNLGVWDTQSLESCQFMFHMTEHLSSVGDLGAWNKSNLEPGDGAANIFVDSAIQHSPFWFMPSN